MKSTQTMRVGQWGGALSWRMTLLWCMLDRVVAMVTPPLKVLKDEHIRRALQQTRDREWVRKRGRDEMINKRRMEMEVGGVGVSNGAGVQRSLYNRLMRPAAADTCFTSRCRRQLTYHEAEPRTIVAWAWNSFLSLSQRGCINLKDWDHEILS